MSSVHAVKQDLVFTLKVASFYPIPTEELMKEFSDWVSAKGKEHNFVISSVSVLVQSKEQK
jgi:hypothetical protein